MASTPASCLPGAIKAIVSILRADAALASLLGGQARIYTRAPDGQAPPYVWALSGEEVPDNQLRTYGKRATIDLLVVSRYEGTEELDAITSRVMELLDNRQGVELPGYGTGRFEWIRNDRPAVEDVNGEPYFERLCVVGVQAR